MSSLRDRIAAFAAERSGASAVEFALVFPVLMMLVFGVIGFSMLGGAISAMHYAVEEGARCYAVNKVACGAAGKAETYARDRYLGPQVDPVFVASKTGCGFTVSATATFELDFALIDFDVPLEASACYPGKDA